MGSDWRANRRGEWYVVVQAVLMAAVAAGPWLGPGGPSPASGPALAVGSALGVLGTAFSLWALGVLGRNLTPFPHPKEGASLVTTGAYRLVRHPIYTGIALASLGWGLAWASPLTLVLAAALFVLFDAKSRREERALVVVFPEYRAYRERVRRLVPFVY